LHRGIVKAPHSGEKGSSMLSASEVTTIWRYTNVYIIIIIINAPMHINSHTKFQLGFSKFLFFNGQNGQDGGTASLCQILSKSLQTRGRDIAIFRFFKMAAAAMLDV